MQSSTTEAARTQADYETAVMLGEGWFELQSDIEMSQLGKEVKTYNYSLGYGDYFVVRIHEHGAAMQQTATGAWKQTKDISKAFRIAKQMKGRNKVLTSMMGGA